MAKTINSDPLYKKLVKSIEGIEKALQQQIIIELYKINITQHDIARNLGIGAGVVNKLLKGIKKERKHGKKAKSKNSKKTKRENR